MRDVLVFMGEHPVVTIILALMAMSIVQAVVFRLPNRIMRHWNIHKHGYPPPHCDADGDFRETSE